MVVARAESWIRDILCSGRESLAQGALRHGSEPGKWFHRVPSGARQHNFCAEACSSKAMAVQDAIFCRLDDLPDSRILMPHGLAKGLVLIQGILGRLRNKVAAGRYKGLIFVFLTRLCHINVSPPVISLSAYALRIIVYEKSA